MDTLLKYIFYIALIFVIYLVIAGFYQGKINKDSTIGEVTGEVSDNAKRIISNTYDKAADTIQEATADDTDETTQNSQVENN